MPERPTSVEEFEDCTGILLDAVVGALAADDRTGLTVEHWRWFSEHVGWRLCYMHANKPKQRKKMEAGETGLAVVCAFVAHWFEAFRRDPEVYMERHVVDPRFFDQDRR